MNSVEFEQRLRAYKQQKYKLLLAKQSVSENSNYQQDSVKLVESIDRALLLVDNAIGACERIYIHLLGIENEIKGYQIIEQKLEDLMFENNWVEASTRMATNKLNRVGEELLEIEQLLKNKS